MEGTDGQEGGAERGVDGIGGGEGDEGGRQFRCEDSVDGGEAGNDMGWKAGL